MPITTLHPDYIASQDKRSIVRDCLDEEAVEKAGEKYLPKPPARSQDDHDLFMEEAFFYGVCSWTLLGMVGAIFRKPGVVELPTAIEYLIHDIDGQGFGALEQAKTVTNNVLPVGRHGLLLDHPEAPEGLSKAQRAELNLRWSVASYNDQSIINWREEDFGGITQLTMVVLREAHSEVVDDFERKEVIRYRYLLLTLDGYEEQVWTPKDGITDHKKDSDFNVVTHLPTANGKRIPFIPFVFIGAEDNKPGVDQPPFYSLSKANIAHYRNSANWESSLSGLLRPTLYMSGMTEDFIDLLKKENLFPFKMGSSDLLPVPPGGQVGLVESLTDKLPIERGMASKERLMAMLGARLVEDKKQTEAAETHRIREGGKTSVLSSVANNVEKAYRQILFWAAYFVTGSTEDVVFNLNHDFFEQQIDSKQALEWLQVWQGRGMAKGDFHTLMQKGGAIAQDRDRETVDADLIEETSDLPRVSNGDE